MISVPPAISSGTDPPSEDQNDASKGNENGDSSGEVQGRKERVPKAASEKAKETLAIMEGNKEILENENGSGSRSGMETPEQIEVEEVIEDIEEGEVVTGWSDVTPGKVSNSPKISPEYGQVKIASRFNALNQVDENGDLVDQEKEAENGNGNSDEDEEEETVAEVETMGENPTTPGRKDDHSEENNSSVTEQGKDMDTL
ncbi:hypothetical protein F2Q68_00018624 [Brassica cretica]|uniref:Uncharacterized protein n=1 Tax=Brassica cretica TaxID=69181 RepID=A0A8S9G971_BRACR|nr:hypothetical protein F2Q68_00018624 [Brassica cretica]